MIIFRYLTREVSKSQIAVFLVLITIFVSQKFVQILADASDGDIPGYLVMTLVSLKLPQLAGLLLPLSTFLGILLAYGRIYAESEMTIFHACGVSEWYVTRVTMVIGLVATILTATVTLWLSPWAKEKEYQVEETAQADMGLSALTPGRFQFTGNEESVIFVHSINPDNYELQKVFVAQTFEGPANPQNRRNIVYAETGKVLEDEFGAQILTLENGRRYESDGRSLITQMTEFDVYQIQIREQQVEQRRRKLTAVPTTDLMADGDNLDAVAELQWRIALPLSIPLLTLIAVPLSAVNPRQGKFARMLPALMLYLGYYVLLIAGRSAIENGAIPKQVGMWWIHLTALAIGLTLILKSRAMGNQIRARFKRRSAS